jgi:16S rRNA (uracil1498-N3)-methyltransferase
MADTPTSPSSGRSPRRVFVAGLCVGRVRLPEETAHYLANVLRLEEGAAVTAFDAGGRSGAAVLLGGGVLEVSEVREAAVWPRLTLASAVPKGDRADVLVEKLAELGVARFVPMRTERSVVHPEGTGKLSRWERIAVEAARQSEAPLVLEIAPLMTLPELVKTWSAGTKVWLAVTQSAGMGPEVLPGPDVVLVGPEGGWSEAETGMLLGQRSAEVHPVTLGPTVLRVETAGVIGASAGLGRLRMG